MNDALVAIKCRDWLRAYKEAVKRSGETGYQKTHVHFSNIYETLWADSRSLAGAAAKKGVESLPLSSIPARIGPPAKCTPEEREALDDAAAVVQKLLAAVTDGTAGSEVFPAAPALPSPSTVDVETLFRLTSRVKELIGWMEGLQRGWRRDEFNILAAEQPGTEPVLIATEEELYKFDELDSAIASLAGALHIPLLPRTETNRRFAIVRGHTGLIHDHHTPRICYDTSEWFRKISALLVAIEERARLSASDNVQVIGSPTPRRPKRKVHPAADARDKWLYEQCCELVQYDTIVRRLKKKPKSWDRIDSKQGIRAAANRYAARQGLPQIPPRQGL